MEIPEKVQELTLKQLEWLGREATRMQDVIEAVEDRLNKEMALQSKVLHEYKQLYDFVSSQSPETFEKWNKTEHEDFDHQEVLRWVEYAEK